MSTDDDTTSLPKSMRHKQILDVAADDPEASIEDIASDVPSATTDLVERVLEKYGDPAAADSAVEKEQNSDPEVAKSGDDEGADDESEATDSAVNETESGSEQSSPESESSASVDTAADSADSQLPLPDPDSITGRQLEALGEIAEHPTATQRDLADRLDVSGATVSNRVNSIDGFDWSERAAFVEALFDSDEFDPPSPTSKSSDAAQESDDNQAEDAAETGATESDTQQETAMSKNSKENGAATEGTESTATTEDPTPDTDVAAQLEALTDRIATLEAAVADAESTDQPSLLEDPELVHKLVRAAMESDSISEDEEIRIIEEILR